jgi:hypothetical protein
LDETKRAIPKAARRSSIRAYTLLVRVLAFSGASDDCKGSRRAIMKMHSVIGLIGGAALLTAAPVSLHRSQNTVALSLDSADARIGRPRTALSVAGVQRRGYRRAYRGAVYGAIAGYGTGSYYSGYSSPASSAPSNYGYSGYGYPSYSAPYYGSGYGPYYGGYGFSTAPLYKPVTFRLPGWRY